MDCAQRRNKVSTICRTVKQNGIPVKWETLKDTYRYDKRLLVNVFKYLSFFEEFLRAQIWNIDKADYKKLEKCFLLEVIDKISTIKDKINYNGFSTTALEQSKEKINYLRNCVAHNKIILENRKRRLTYKRHLECF